MRTLFPGALQNFIFILIYSVLSFTGSLVYGQEIAQGVKKIQVLNFGTFHMGATSDATKTEFDEHNRKNQRAAHKVARELAAFQPTVIIVELPPSYDEALQARYESYIKNPRRSFADPTEIELLAFEVGRLSGTTRIYGIDHKMEYNYKVGHEIENTTDPAWYMSYYQDPVGFHPIENPNEESLSLKEKLSITNTPEFLDFLMAVNADMLTHAASEDGFEGADEAARFYQRNLRMYTNLNRIGLKENDRVFLLMGAAHTAFFRDFFRRSPKYQMVDTASYID